MNKKIIILGAGLAGISAGYRLKQKNIDFEIFEKENEYGGLCRKLKIGKFIFDRFPHFSFTKDKQIRELFDISSNEYYRHIPTIANYYKGLWLGNPAQSNLYPLSKEEKIQIIESFKNRPNIENPKNYREWLDASFGYYFAKEFSDKYTRKYWTTEPENMSVDWVGYRVMKSNLDEIEYGAWNNDNKSKYYASEMRYPKYGGFQSFFDSWTPKENIKFNHNLIRWNVKKKELLFDNGYKTNYNKIISTLPLTYIANIIEDIPDNVKEAASKLCYTSGYTVSIGLKGKVNVPYLWFYVYDEEILFPRVYIATLKSPNNAPEGYSSLQVEIPCSKFKKINLNNNEIVEHAINKLDEMKIFNSDQVEFAQLDYHQYANILFTTDTENNKKIVLDWLKENDIHIAGRYGKWEYYWTDQTIKSGFETANNLN